MTAQTDSELQTELATRGLTVSCAESLTGGELAARLSSVPGASAVFLGGVVCYATQVKRQVLGVTADLVVSAECAAQLATGVRDLLGSDWALATTGVAGPDEQEGQPVGTVFVGTASPDGVTTRRLDLDGDRATIRRETVRLAAEELLRQVRGG